MSMNQPLDADPDTAPDAHRRSTKELPSLTPAQLRRTRQSIRPKRPSSTRSLARVLVTVPRSFYLGRWQHRDPSLDELQALDDSDGADHQASRSRS